ncbi:MAG: hypothetical protein ACKOC9_00950 [Alphaproteobacteria bacterium]
MRDAAGNPQDMPVRLRLRRPNGQIAAEVTPPRLMGGAISWVIKSGAKCSSCRPKRQPRQASKGSGSGSRRISALPASPAPGAP